MLEAADGLLELLGGDHDVGRTADGGGRSDERDLPDTIAVQTHTPVREPEDLVRLQVGHHVVEQGRDEAGELEGQVPAHRLFPDRVHEALLPLHATEVHVPIVPKADEVQRVYAVKELIAGLYVDLLPGAIVVEVTSVHVDVDPPEGIDDVFERTEPDLQVVVDVHTGESLHRPDGKGSTPIAKSRVELAGTVSGDADPQIARQREDGEVILVGIDMDEHDRVRPAH